MGEKNKWVECDEKIKRKIHPTPLNKYPDKKLMFLGPDGNYHSASALTEDGFSEDDNPDWSALNIRGRKF